MTSHELKAKVRGCLCKTCRALVSLVDEAGAKLVFSPTRAGRLCELAVVAATGREGLPKDEVVERRRAYANHLGITLDGRISNADTPAHIEHAITDSNHNPNADTRVNLGRAHASFDGSRYFLTWSSSKRNEAEPNSARKDDRDDGGVSASESESPVLPEIPESESLPGHVLDDRVPRVRQIFA